MNEPRLWHTHIVKLERLLNMLYYGRKVEQAIKFRKQGYQIVLAHENDFFDTIA